MQPPLTIVDPHIHLWDLSTGLYPHFEKPGPDGSQPTTYALSDFMAEGGPKVAGAVHVEAFPTDPVRETEVVQAIADKSPIPIMMVGNADMVSPDFEAILEAQASFPIFRGIRQVVNRHKRPELTQASRDLLSPSAFAQSLRLLGQRGFSFDLQLLPHQMVQAAEIAGKSPDTQIVVNHTGMWADRDLDGWQIWKRGMQLLAERPNVWVKISGLGMMDKDWTTESIRPQIYETLEAFGVERALFASNFPVDKATSSYAALWQAFDAVTANFSGTERNQLFVENARQFYRFPAT